MHNILVVDDDNDMCLLLTRFLTRNGYQVASANSGKSAMEWMKKNAPDLVLCDFRLDDMTGVELITKIKETYPQAAVIIITGYSDVKDAVEVMKLGAYDYVTKPLFPDEILLTIKKALSEEPKENVALKPQGTNGVTSNSKPKNVTNSQYIMGDSPEFAAIIKQIDLVAPTNFSVIIY